MGELIDFSDGGDNRVLYIDEIPRPIEPWHAILNQIVPHILVEPFRTADVHYGVHAEGWRNLVDCLAEHGDGLSLPSGFHHRPWRSSTSELRHKLWLQDCFDALSGLGQDEGLTLENEEQQDRIDEFIAALRDHSDSIQFFNLTLDSLLERVILPEKDKTIFVRMMQDKLGIKSTAEPIADYLGQGEQGLLSEEERLEQEEQRLLLEKERLERELREANLKEQSLRRQLAERQSQQEATAKKIGRNDPCPCGSGKKFKKCCIKKYQGSD